MTYMEDPIWFAPLNVIFHFNELRNEHLSIKDKRFKKAEEAFRVAIMLVGIMAIQKKKYWMQIVSDDMGSPDIRTGNYKEPRGTPNNTWITQEVEVVVFDDHSNERLPEFIKRTKLSRRKAYDSLITILCYIKKDFQLPPLKTLVEDLKKENCLNPIIVLGKTSPNEESYKMAQVNPVLDLTIEFDLIKELKEKMHTGVLSLKRGAKPVFKHQSEEKHFPFEKIGFAK